MFPRPCWRCPPPGSRRRRRSRGSARAGCDRTVSTISSARCPGRRSRESGCRGGLDRGDPLPGLPEIRLPSTNYPRRRTAARPSLRCRPTCCADGVPFDSVIAIPDTLPVATPRRVAVGPVEGVTRVPRSRARPGRSRLPSERRTPPDGELLDGPAGDRHAAPAGEPDALTACGAGAVDRPAAEVERDVVVTDHKPVARAVGQVGAKLRTRGERRSAGHIPPLASAAAGTASTTRARATTT